MWFRARCRDGIRRTRPGPRACANVRRMFPWRKAHRHPSWKGRRLRLRAPAPNRWKDARHLPHSAGSAHRTHCGSSARIPNARRKGTPRTARKRAGSHDRQPGAQPGQQSHGVLRRCVNVPRPTHTCIGFSRAVSMPNTLIARATSRAFMVPSFASASMAAWAMW